jgi:hypothetical protein
VPLGRVACRKGASRKGGSPQCLSAPGWVWAEASSPPGGAAQARHLPFSPGPTKSRQPRHPHEASRDAYCPPWCPTTRVEKDVTAQKEIQLLGSFLWYQPGLMPLPGFARLYRPVHRALLAEFLPASVALSSASTGQNRQRNCFPSAMLTQQVDAAISSLRRPLTPVT